ncbi:intradiol ring-cleavage dioxygenase [Undibacterium cyanobacteriorum]|uniref:Intradiol ring-cleavage dioxygenase n=1 Tax=Undibacterium cyanobacteriorum TaxID=3073561 RepID=A0ABY9RKU3_9BURK|nr:intradiol ring-cleavage dioxygenase [Undibacterium sp. 20NA77.5]WMW81300.1 intradiol ring-cleavage dioxygenase [Undibacterium sp. 20NA77.5]
MKEHGLAADLDAILALNTDRRQSLRWLAVGLAGLPLLGCGGGDSVASVTSTSTSTGSGSTSGTSGSGTCSVIPEETAGPYPGDGTNSNTSGIVNVLAMSGVVRRDIRASFNGASAVADGVPLTIKLKINNANASCGAAGGFSVYLWHCDKDGNYSLYSSGVTNQNYLRGVQEADANGEIIFTSIYPGCYSGRVPHIHFEIFPSLAKSTSVLNRIKTSQLTFPTAISQEVYTDSRYSASVRNLAQISFATDNVFSDGTSLQMATVTGNLTEGYVASLTINVSA